jgi:hypothetical protein
MRNDNSIRRIGVDFDNTIVCYDELFHRVACEWNLIPANLPATKQAVRDDLRRRGQEDIWTEMQGHVYGARMVEAAPFPGVVEFFMHCRSVEIPVSIISHKTRYPFRGPTYDLHRAAHEWLLHHGFYDVNRIGLTPSRVYFEPTRQDKLKRIVAVGCSHFIDDLPEFLNAPEFPAGVMRLLFSPNQQPFNEPPDSVPSIVRVASWKSLNSLISGKETDIDSRQPAGRRPTP